jgi:hypothetical protein
MLDLDGGGQSGTANLYIEVFDTGVDGGFGEVGRNRLLGEMGW